MAELLQRDVFESKMNELIAAQGGGGGSEDAGPAWTPVPFRYVSNDLTGGQPIVPASPGQLGVIEDLFISSAVDLIVSITDGSTARAIHVAGKVPVQVTLRSFIRANAVNTAIGISASAAGAISVFGNYHYEA